MDRGSYSWNNVFKLKANKCALEINVSYKNWDIASGKSVDKELSLANLVTAITDSPLPFKIAQNFTGLVKLTFEVSDLYL